MFEESAVEPTMKNTDTTEIDKASDFKPEEKGRIIKNCKRIKRNFLSMIFFLFLKNQQLNPLSKVKILLKSARLLILNLQKTNLKKKVEVLKIVNTLKLYYYPYFSFYFSRISS